MSILLPRFFRSAFRNDPIARFLITMGAADVVLGSVSGHGGLFLLGVILFGGALSLKWTHSQRRIQNFTEQTAQHYLPSESSQAELPMLSISKKRPPSSEGSEF